MLLGTDAYPRAVWQPNEIVVTRFQVPTNSDSPVIANIRLDVPPYAEAVALGRVTVMPSRACATDRVADATFDGSIKLIGYRIEEGATPRIVLCWQALKSTPIDYTVFVHVPSDTGMIGGDGQPVSGNYPTSVWQPGQVIEDVHSLPAGSVLKIPSAAIGLYRLDTGERLPIDGTGATEFELIK